MDKDIVVDSDVHFYGASLEGYPNVRQFGNYNEKLSIDNEMPQMEYRRTNTDDLSYVWATNNLDNIDGLNKVLRDADVNAYDVDFYGAKNLNVVSNDPDFATILKINPVHCHSAPEYQLNVPEIKTYHHKKNHKLLWLVFLVVLAILLTGGFDNICGSLDKLSKEMSKTVSNALTTSGAPVS
jgi:hypothetical protein